MKGTLASFNVSLNSFYKNQENKRGEKGDLSIAIGICEFHLSYF